MTTNPANKNDNTLVLLFLAACVCASLFCCISSLSTSAFLMSGEKNDDTSPTPSPSNIPPPPVKISTGTSVKCSANELRGNENSVYRSMEDGTLAHYPNPEIASSWDSDWSENIMEVDCEGFTKGEDVKMKSYFDEGVDYTIKGSRADKYCANDSEDGMICDRDDPDGWEKFQFTQVGSDIYAIKSNRTNKQCKDNRGSVSKCDTDHIQQHEKFVIEKHGDKYSIKGGWGDKYCSDQPGGFICDSDNKEWEKFTIKKVN